MKLVIVHAHFYHNLWYVTDGLKGFSEFMLATLNSFHGIKAFFFNEDIYFAIQILCNFYDNFGKILRTIPGKTFSHPHMVWLDIKNLKSHMSSFIRVMHTITWMVRQFPVHRSPSNVYGHTASK